LSSLGAGVVSAAASNVGAAGRIAGRRGGAGASAAKRWHGATAQLCRAAGFAALAGAGVGAETC
jgi:hypothetical protein